MDWNLIFTICDGTKYFLRKDAWQKVGNLARIPKVQDWGEGSFNYLYNLCRLAKNHELQICTKIYEIKEDVNIDCNIQ